MFLDINDFNMYVNQTYSVNDIYDVSKDIEVESSNPEIVEFKNNTLVAKKEGEVEIFFKLNGYYQNIKITVSLEDKDATTFAFNVGNLYGKKLAAFGDSVTDDNTIGCPKTYPHLLENNFNMTLIKNYGIGGTTATYMYEGSNIDKEYHTNNVAIDGCRVIKRAVEAHELDDCDYAFIAFGHNDQYFQPPIDSKDDPTNLLSLENCKSFKASYRYMIRMLRKANPNIRIVILNCTYSQYDITMAKTYEHILTYDDYRKAEKEIAEEFNCRYLDPWDYLHQYFVRDFNKYYKDSVHLTPEGHEVLYNFIINN